MNERKLRNTKESSDIRVEGQLHPDPTLQKRKKNGSWSGFDIQEKTDPDPNLEKNNPDPQPWGIYIWNEEIIEILNKWRYC